MIQDFLLNLSNRFSNESLKRSQVEETCREDSTSYQTIKMPNKTKKRNNYFFVKKKKKKYGEKHAGNVTSNNCLSSRILILSLS